MESRRLAELLDRYRAESLEVAEKVASGYAWILDESQPVDDGQLSLDIDDMRAILRSTRGTEDAMEES